MTTHYFMGSFMASLETTTNSATKLSTDKLTSTSVCDLHPISSQTIQTADPNLFQFGTESLYVDGHLV